MAGSEKLASILLTGRPACRDQRLATQWAVAALALSCACVAPFARTALPRGESFLVLYESASVIFSAVTAALLYSRALLEKSARLHVLASGYVFSALMATFHALTFPGLFTPTGLLGAGPQTTAWLYFLWHAGLAAALIAYAASEGSPASGSPPRDAWMRVAKTLGAGVAAAVILLALTTLGHGLLPRIMTGDADLPSKYVVSALTVASAGIALALLMRRESPSVLDLWLVVVVAALLCGTALASLLNSGRFSLGWYAGRLFELVSAALLLVVFLAREGWLMREFARALSTEEEQRRAIEDATRRLALAEQRWQFALEGAGQGVWDWDVDTGKIYFSPRYGAMLGYGQGELGDTGREWSDRLHPDDRAQALAALDRYARGELPRFDLEFRMRRKDGAYRWIWSRALIVERGPGGRPRRIIGTHADVTRRRHAERELGAARSKLEAAMASMSDALYLSDEDANLVDFNDAFVRLHRFGSRDACARSLAGYADLFELRSPDGAQPTVEDWPTRRALRGETGSGVEYKVRRKDTGESWDASYSFAPIRDPDGRIVGAVTTARDITELRRTQRELDALNAEVERMMQAEVAAQTVAAIAHELNQPLVAVTAYAEAALRMLRAGGRETDAMREAIEGGADQAKRAGEILHSLVTFLSRGEVRAEPFDLNELVRRVVQRTREHYREELDIRIDLAPDMPRVRGSPLQIEKVLGNLITNGVEAVRAAGSDARAITVSIRTSDDGLMAQATVRDTGPGVDEKIRHRIFEPFFTTKRSGLGMGLAVSRALVEAHGGQLWLEPGPGPGAAFHLTLPLQR